MSQPTPLIILAAPDPRVRESTIALETRGFEVAGATHSAQVHRLLDYNPHALVVLDDALPLESAWAIYQLLSERSTVPALLVVDGDSYGQLSCNTQRPRFEEYVPKPVGPDELVLRVSALAARAGLGLPSAAASAATASMHTSGTAYGSAADLEADQVQSRGQITAVFALKGGVGKSTVAANLAVGLAVTQKQRTVLVDADLMAGQVGVLLDRDDRQGIFDLCLRGMRDAESLASIVASHATGVDLLLRPPELVQAEQLDSSHLVEALPVLATRYQQVVVDLNPCLSELNMQLLDMADRVIVVTTPDLPSLTTTSRLLTVAGDVGWLHKIEVVLNHAGIGIDAEDVEKTLNRKLAARVAHDGRLVVKAANMGQALLQMDPRQKHRVTRDLAQLARIVARGTESIECGVKSKGKWSLFGGARMPLLSAAPRRAAMPAA